MINYKHIREKSGKSGNFEVKDKWQFYSLEKFKFVGQFSVQKSTEALLCMSIVLGIGILLSFQVLVEVINPMYSERPKLHGVLAVMSAIGLKVLHISFNLWMNLVDTRAYDRYWSSISIYISDMRSSHRLRNFMLKFSAFTFFDLLTLH